MAKVARFEMPDGRIARFEVPDDATPESAHQMMSAHFGESKPAKSDEPSLMDSVKEQAKSDFHNVGNLAAGAVRGAASIGSTVMRVLPNALGGDTAEENEQRRKDVDSALATLGAEPDSLMYKGGKLGAEIAGTFGAGGAIANTAARIPGIASAVPNLLQALRTSGMTTGAKVAPGAKNALADLGIRTVGGAAAGGAQAGIVEPEDAATGAAVGGALPGALKVLGKAGNVIGTTFTKSGAQRNALDKIVEAGGDPRNIAGEIQTYYPKGAENIPVSAAAIVGKPGLAQLEQGSRLKTTAPWSDFDQKQGKAVFDNLTNATKEADELGRLQQARRDNWTQAWEKASDAQKPRIWNKRMTQLGGDLEMALASPEASNPAVRSVLEAVKNEVIRVGPSFSPGHLQQIRANLNGKANPMSPDAFKSAPRDSHAIITLKQELDDILNATTGGKWQKVIEGYAEDSTKVHASKAAAKVRSAFVDGETGRVRGVSLDPNGEIPKVTEAGLGRALDAARLPDKSLALSADANNAIEATLGALRRQNVVQGVKRSATAGGGSDTVSNAISAAANGASGSSVPSQVIRWLKDVGTSRTDKELAALLTNPDELAKEIQKMLAKKPGANPLLGLTYRSAPALATSP